MRAERVSGKRRLWLWRPLVGIVVAYAVAAQSLLIALGGFSLPAQTNDGASAFELCIHDSRGTAEIPAGTPDSVGCTHCIFCFAGAHQAVAGNAPEIAHRVVVAVIDATRPLVDLGPSRLPFYAIAHPRGPPRAA
jgi:hypothetical protein